LGYFDIFLNNNSGGFKNSISTKNLMYKFLKSINCQKILKNFSTECSLYCWYFRWFVELKKIIGHVWNTGFPKINNSQTNLKILNSTSWNSIQPEKMKLKYPFLPLFSQTNDPENERLICVLSHYILDNLWFRYTWWTH
jgi:hypothetical protein